LPLMDLYKEQVGGTQFKRFVRCEEAFEWLLDRFIEQAEMNSTSLRCKEAANGFFFVFKTRFVSLN
jgi:hypothetical protein